MNNYSRILKELEEEGYGIEGLGVIGIIKPDKEKFPTLGDRILASQHNVIIKLLIQQQPTDKIDEITEMFKNIKVNEDKIVPKKKPNRQLWYVKEINPKDLAV